MSKDLFFEMRAEQMATMYAETFTKKKAIETGENLVKSVFEDGVLDPIHVFTNLARLKAVIDTADKAFRDRLSVTKESWNGVELTSKNGSKKLNYTDDPVYNDLVKKVKDREELLKAAHNSSDVIFDSEGCEVPKVSASFSKSSITVTF